MATVVPVKTMGKRPGRRAAVAVPVRSEPLTPTEIYTGGNVQPGKVTLELEPVATIAPKEFKNITATFNEMLRWDTREFLKLTEGGYENYINGDLKRWEKLTPAHILAAARFAAASDPQNRNGNGAMQLIIDRVEGAVTQEQNINIRVDGVADQARREREAKRLAAIETTATVLTEDPVELARIKRIEQEELEEAAEIMRDLERKGLAPGSR